MINFSYVTLTSTGYGDVFPVHPVAHSLCNLATIIGQLYPETLLAKAGIAQDQRPAPSGAGREAGAYCPPA